MLLPLFDRLGGSRNSEASESVCWAVGNMGYPEVAGQSSLGSGGCLIVVRVLGDALKSHPVDAAVVQEGLRAMRSLCHLHPGNCEWLLSWEGDLCKVLVGLLDAFKDRLLLILLLLLLMIIIVVIIIIIVIIIVIIIIIIIISIIIIIIIIVVILIVVIISVIAVIIVIIIINIVLVIIVIMIVIIIIIIIAALVS